MNFSDGLTRLLNEKQLYQVLSDDNSEKHMRNLAGMFKLYFLFTCLGLTHSMRLAKEHKNTEILSRKHITGYLLDGTCKQY